MSHNNIGESMHNFFEKNSKNSSNPFAIHQETNNEKPLSDGKRLNIVDMDVINNTNNSDLEYMEIRMNNLYNIIHKKSQSLDPITLENMKIEWETLRDKVYKEKQKLLLEKNSAMAKSGFSKILTRGFNKLITLFKLYNPKIKEIMASFNEINAEVENLVRHSTPVGEEEKKYGMLVNKINQATKLNYRLSSEIKQG